MYIHNIPSTYIYIYLYIYIVYIYICSGHIWQHFLLRNHRNCSSFLFSEAPRRRRRAPDGLADHLTAVEGHGCSMGEFTRVMENPWRIYGESMENLWLLMIDDGESIYLVGGWTLPLCKIWKSIGMMIPNIWKNKTCSKPPTCIRIHWWLDKVH